MKLNELKNGQSAKVKKITGDMAAKKKLMDMGLTKNAVVTMRKAAPLGDPLELHVRGYELTLRKKDASMIEIEMV